MNGLPIDVDLSALLGARIEQVCVGQNECIINFGTASPTATTRLTIESECSYLAPAGVVTEVEKYADAATQLCELLGSTVVAWRRIQNGGLELRVDTGAVLRIYNDNPHYESFYIDLDGTTIVA